MVMTYTGGAIDAAVAQHRNVINPERTGSLVDSGACRSCVVGVDDQTARASKAVAKIGVARLQQRKKLTERSKGAKP